MTDQQIPPKKPPKGNGGGKSGTKEPRPAPIVRN